MDQTEALKTIHDIACDARNCSEFAFRDIDKIVREAINQLDGPIIPATEFRGEVWSWRETMKASKREALERARSLSLAELKALVAEKLVAEEDA